jgi:hypothetical protein
MSVGSTIAGFATAGELPAARVRAPDDLLPGASRPSNIGDCRARRPAEVEESLGDAGPVRMAISSASLLVERARAAQSTGLSGCSGGRCRRPRRRTERAPVGQWDAPHSRGGGGAGHSGNDVAPDAGFGTCERFPPAQDERIPALRGGPHDAWPARPERPRHPAGCACSSVSQGRDRRHRQTIANKGDDNYDLSSRDGPQQTPRRRLA